MKNKKIFLVILLFSLIKSNSENSLRVAEFVRIKDYIPTIETDLVFATGHDPLDINIIMYPSDAEAYAHKGLVKDLAEVQTELAQSGLGILVRDAYRPMWAQKKLWDIIQTFDILNPQFYISDPKTDGGRHPRGTAVDITLIRLDTKQKIPMPPFRFAEVSHSNYVGSELTDTQINNREMLKSIMRKHGFSTIRCEWWHFDWRNWRQFIAVNKTFKEIKKTIKT